MQETVIRSPNFLPFFPFVANPSQPSISLLHLPKASWQEDIPAKAVTELPCAWNRIHIVPLQKERSLVKEKERSKDEEGFRCFLRLCHEPRGVGICGL
jgi:hypothetical protein